jgi:hypothetical protein
MTLEEKRAWIRMIVGVLAYATYVVIVLRRAGDTPLPDVAYAATLLWTIGAAIVASIVVEIVAQIVAGIANPRVSQVKDVRDKEIGRLGEYTGQSFLVLGAVVALLMALANWDQFWIANVIYLAFVLSMVLGSITKVVVYRRSFPQW